MSSDSEEENFDISNALTLNAGFSSDDDSGSSASENEAVQDEIISSDDDSDSDSDNDGNTNVKKSSAPKSTSLSFPKLEHVEEDNEDAEDLKGRRRKPISDEDFFASLQQEAAAASGKKKSAGSFAGMGLSKYICVNISKKGFRNPTPIQRKTIPLVLEGRDVVGMARTGSGKTAAFVLPMIERLKVHSAKVGARAVILSPSRELALQTMKVVRDFSKGTDLRSVLLVGGDSLEDQFGMIMSNPDIIIATPGRFLHLKVEMQLDLSSIEYIVFDEADRLFELGFSEQLNEILGSLSPNRQTLLFSATLPRSLVDFAKAGLQDPTLVRLDAETKISDQLEMAYFSIKDGEREAALAYILQDVIKMPPATEEELAYLKKLDLQLPSEDEDENDNSEEKKKKKQIKPNHKQIKLPAATELPSPHSTIVFTPTKHHVEYIANLLKSLDYAVSYIYGTLDQTARKDQLYRFRAGKTTILVVTDVAARGIDIPVLANVINYSLPSSPKVFIHRVGRTARAGRRGWAYTIVKEQDLPYLLDLELFLGRKLLFSSQHNSKTEVSYTNRLVMGSLPREGLEHQMEEVEAVVKESYDIQQLRDVARKGEKLYLKTRGIASHESAKRSKEILIDAKWDEQHLMFGPSLETERESFLNKLANRKKKETVFEFKKTSYGSAAELMERRRRQIAPIQRRAAERKEIQKKEREAGLLHTEDAEVFHNFDEDANESEDDDVESKKRKRDDETVSENELLESFKEAPSTEKKSKSFRDPQFYMSHYASSNVAEDRAYSVSGGNSFFGDAARGATFDLNGEGTEFQQKQGMKWDKKRGKFVNAGSTDSKGNSTKFIRGEGGTKIPASYRSGRFDNWKQAHKSKGLRVGTMEDPTTTPGPGSSNNKKYKHNKVEAPKRADKARDDYHIRKQRVNEAVGKGLKVKGHNARGGQAVSNGIQSVTQVRKAREQKERKKEKNARPSKKGGRR
ncbi:hypothetical protein DV451_001227 [Geotrichum candidum]|uniref:ATP-dependent RNA helicase DBP10 n=1 Tax=Geotrichum candidum TaxID=1173061 RepID=A0A9P5KVW5_GEOCN|nr:hypothetical protein DV451_001227 [Geotrichum candidum]